MAQHKNDYERVIETLQSLAGGVARPVNTNDQEYLELLVSRTASRLGSAPVAPRAPQVTSVPVLETVKAKLDEAVEAVTTALSPSVVVTMSPVIMPPNFSAEADALRRVAEALPAAEPSARQRVLDILNGPGDATTKADLITTAVADRKVTGELLADMAYSGQIPRGVAMELARMTGR